MIKLSWQKIAQIEVKLFKIPWGLHTNKIIKGIKDKATTMYEE